MLGLRARPTRYPTRTASAMKRSAPKERARRGAKAPKRIATDAARTTPTAAANAIPAPRSPRKALDRRAMSLSSWLRLNTSLTSESDRKRREDRQESDGDGECEERLDGSHALEKEPDGPER